MSDRPASNATLPGQHDGPRYANVANPGEHTGPRCSGSITTPSFAQRVVTFGEALAAKKEAALLSGAIVYFLGYISWAIYASERDLGMIPVLRAQYLSAGILPACVVLGFWWIALFLRRERAKLLQKEWSRAVGTIGMIAGFLVWLWGAIFEERLNAMGFPGKWIYMGGLILFAVSPVLMEGKEAVSLKDNFLVLLEVYARFMGKILFCTVIVLPYAYYVDEWFPRLWQEFGGPRPLHVELDVDRSKLSKNSLQLLAPEWSENSSGAGDVVRSRDTYLILQTADYFFIQMTPGTASSNQIFKIESDAVASVFPIREKAVEKK